MCVCVCVRACVRACVCLCARAPSGSHDSCVFVVGCCCFVSAVYLLVNSVYSLWQDTDDDDFITDNQIKY